MRPALSIITITYNAPDDLRETLRSLAPLAKFPRAWEHVIVDSSPATNQAVISAHKQPYRRVEQPPAGIYAAMNAGLREAQGEIVWFLNGGDRLSSAENLAEILSALEKSGAEMAIGTADLWRDGQFLYPQAPRGGLWPMLGINRICHQAVLYRRSLFDRTGPFSESLKLAGDYELHLKAHALGVNQLLLDRPFVRYDMGGESSNLDGVFKEFRQVHDNLARNGGIVIAPLHGVVRRFEWIRLQTLKRLGKTTIGPSLRKIWRRYRRIRS